MEQELEACVNEGMVLAVLIASEVLVAVWYIKALLSER